jgi:hypothetical protein
MFSLLLCRQWLWVSPRCRSSAAEVEAINESRSPQESSCVKCGSPRDESVAVARVLSVPEPSRGRFALKHLVHNEAGRNALT